MSSVGLLYVGIVLFVNGIMLLGHIAPRGAAPINLFVGALQVYTPTYLIIHADGDPAQIAAAAGLYLFGFTYLWVGINSVADWPGEGLGWFSLTVAACATGFALHSWITIDDQTFAVIWLLWAVLWFEFFLLLALDRPIGPAVGVLAAGEGVLTAGVPGFLLVIGEWEDSTGLAATVAVLGVVLIAVSPAAGRLIGLSVARVPETN